MVASEAPPKQPELDQVFAHDGVEYTWNGRAWVALGYRWKWNEAAKEFDPVGSTTDTRLPRLGSVKNLRRTARGIKGEGK